jgi:type VI secretion system protein ImpJ
MRQLQPILWTKGLLLTPQHLQTQERHFEDQLGFHLAALSPAPWGFGLLQVNLEALGSGVFTLSQASGMFPDSLAFEIPGSDQAPQPRPLEAAWEADQDTLDFYLAIPEHRPGAQNVSRETDSRARYSGEMLLLRDENTGLSEKPVQVARKNLRLLSENESREGYATLRVGRVRKLPTGTYELDPECVPPLLAFSANGALLAMTRGLVEILSARSSALSGLRRQRSQGLAQFGISDVANFWLLYTINTHLPALRHLLEARGKHPLELYRAMTTLAGALSTFSSTIHPASFPEYNHADPGPCFSQLDAIVRELLDTVVPAQFASLALKRSDQGFHATAIDHDRYFKATQWFLAVTTELGPAEVIRRVPQLLKISSASGVERLVRQALPGLGLVHSPQPPAALPIKLNYHYFQLDRNGPEWEAVRKSRNLAVHVPADLPGCQLELLVVLTD